MKHVLRQLSLIVVLALSAGAISRSPGLAQEDMVHIVSGVVKHIDRGTHTIVVKTDEGVENTVKWTDRTTWEGTKESGKGIKDGSKVAVKYTEKAGEKTAVGIKDAAKDTGKALE